METRHACKLSQTNSASLSIHKLTSIFNQPLTETTDSNFRRHYSLAVLAHWLVGEYWILHGSYTTGISGVWGCCCGKELSFFNKTLLRRRRRRVLEKSFSFVCSFRTGPVVIGGLESLVNGVGDWGWLTGFIAFCSWTCKKILLPWPVVTMKTFQIRKARWLLVALRNTVS